MHSDAEMCHVFANSIWSVCVCVTLYRVEAGSVRGSVSESEVVLQTCSQCLCHLVVAVETHSLPHDEIQQFYEKLLGTVSSRTGPVRA